MRMPDGWVAICYQTNNRQVLFSTQELVMCRSCKWGTDQKNGKLNNIKCEIFETLMKERDYCSYGEGNGKNTDSDNIT